MDVDEELTALEHSLWRAETRFDRAHMERVLAEDFVEFGRSGHVHRREDTLAAPAQPLDARLHDLHVTALADDVRLVTYVSEVDGQWGNRASVWTTTDGTWRLVFHQGTPRGGEAPLALRRDLGGGVTLRPLAFADAEALHALVVANRDRLRPWMPWADQDAGATAAFVTAAVLGASRREMLHLAMTDGEAIAGVVSLHSIVWARGSAELGYWVGERSEGRGLVTRAVAAVLDHAYDGLGLHRIELRAAPGNGRSRAVAARLGFAEEGVLREAEPFRDGFRDLVVHARLATDPDPRA